MKKVYAVAQQAEYNECGHEFFAIFDDKSLAEDYLKTIKPQFEERYLQIEEFELNPTKIRLDGYKLFRIEMNKSRDCKKAEEVQNTKYTENTYEFDNSVNLIAYVWALNILHAIEMTYEKHKELINADRWGENSFFNMKKT